FACETSPLSPGLATRTETLTLHWLQTVGTETAGAPPAAPQSHCPFQTHVVAPAAGAGGADAVAGSQFQLQFHSQTDGPDAAGRAGTSAEIAGEFPALVLLVVSAAGAGAAAGGVSGLGSGAADTAGGIAVETGDTEGDSAAATTAGAAATTGGGGVGGVGMTTVTVGTGGSTTTPSARAAAACTAAAASAARRPNGMRPCRNISF